MKSSWAEQSCYSHWRARTAALAFLEERHAPPPERLLQAIWHHQRLRRDQLKTIDGRPLAVFHPGFWNHTAGPDFRQAVVQIGSDAPASGDVEVDLTPDGWRGHAHDRNPGFKHVVLHVVWESGSKSSPLPMLELAPHLDSDIEELSFWLGTESARGWPSELLGHCHAPLQHLSSDALEDLLRQAAKLRFQRKASEFRARARQAGWEQSLREGLLRALGYNQNTWAMQRLAELAPRLTLDGPGPFELQARLLGVSGLLPGELNVRSRAARDYLKQVWELWWRERDAHSNWILPRAVWKLNGIRPANHPHRRIALASHWLAGDSLIEQLDKWFTSDLSGAALVHSLLKILQVQNDEFWSSHWTLRSAPLARPQPLIGERRVTDLAVNVVLPWFWTRAAAGRNTLMQQAAEARFFNWPPGEDNSLLRLAFERLFSEGKRKKTLLRTSAAQQGLMQIVRDFCDHSNAVCGNCLFPELVRNLDGLPANSPSPAS
jgi:hypothetical protein